MGRLICRRRVYGIQFRVCTSCLRGRGLRELSGIVVSDLVLILRPRGGAAFLFLHFNLSGYSYFPCPLSPAYNELPFSPAPPRSKFTFYKENTYSQAKKKKKNRLITRPRFPCCGLVRRLYPKTKKLAHEELDACRGNKRMEWGGERIYGFDGWVRGRGLAEGGGGEVKRVCCKTCMQKGRERGIGEIGGNRVILMGL